MTSDEKRAYKARKEREYRAKRKAEVDFALAQFGDATATLMRRGYTVGRLVDVLLEVKRWNEFVKDAEAANVSGLK